MPAVAFLWEEELQVLVGKWREKEETNRGRDAAVRRLCSALKYIHIALAITRTNGIH